MRPDRVIDVLPAPELWPELNWAVAATGRMGRDAGGSLLLSERELWLDRNDVEDEGLRDALHQFRDAIDLARGKAQRELMKLS